MGSSTFGISTAIYVSVSGADTTVSGGIGGLPSYEWRVKSCSGYSTSKDKKIIHFSNISVI